MIKYAKSRMALVGFATNGMLLTRENCRKIMDTLPDWINISVDSANKQKFEAIRKGADFDILVKNIALLMSFRRKASLPDISIWIVLMKENLEDLVSVIDLAKTCGLKKVSAQLQHSWGKEEGVKFNSGQRHQIKSVISQAKKYAGSKGIRFEYLNVPDINSGRSCKWPWKACYISAEGFITPCCLQGANPNVINFGNIFDSDFRDLWNNAAYQSFRRKLKSKTPPEFCQDCTAYFKRLRI